MWQYLIGMGFTLIGLGVLLMPSMPRETTMVFTRESEASVKTKDGQIYFVEPNVPRAAEEKP